jgi:hypothetical protein
MRRKTREQIQCQHLHADTIYGDEINRTGGRRGHCWECGAWLDGLTLGFNNVEPDRRLTLACEAGEPQ